MMEENFSNAKIKKLDRPKDKVTTIHGTFRIYNYGDNSTVPICYGCWYAKRKGPGAPCVEGTWCGGLHSILILENRT
jgi:hypothetical protein